MELNGVADQVTKLEEVLQSSVIETDLDSVKIETGRVTEATDCMAKVKGQILENQGKLAAFELDSSTLDQTLKRTQQETQSLSTKLIEKSAYHKSICEGMLKQLKEQQMPVVPLQRPDELNIPNPSWMQTSSGYEDTYKEQGIPTMITWSSGGSEVAVEGSWDDWKSRKALQKTCKDFTIMKVLPSGVYQYRFIVDGQWRYSPDLPWDQDESGHAYNILDLQTSKLTHQERRCSKHIRIRHLPGNKRVTAGRFVILEHGNLAVLAGGGEPGAVIPLEDLEVEEVDDVPNEPNSDSDNDGTMWLRVINNDDVCLYEEKIDPIFDYTPVPDQENDAPAFISTFNVFLRWMDIPMQVIETGNPHPPHDIQQLLSRFYVTFPPTYPYEITPVSEARAILPPSFRTLSTLPIRDVVEGYGSVTGFYRLEDGRDYIPIGQGSIQDFCERVSELVMIVW